jgi:hypothetical protein
VVLNWNCKVALIGTKSPNFRYPMTSFYLAIIILFLMFLAPQKMVLKFEVKG